SWTHCPASAKSIRRRSLTAGPTKPKQNWFAKRSFPRPLTPKSRTKSLPSNSEHQGGFMTVFDDVCGKALSSMFGNSSNPLAASVLQMINNQPGGLGALIQGFREKGLGEVVNSWISTGQNLPISADQIQQALGNNKLQEIAQQSGVSADSVSSQLSS